MSKHAAVIAALFVVALQAYIGAAAAARPAGGVHARPCGLACLARRLLQQPSSSKWDSKRDNRDTIGSAYASQKGSDPTGPGDAFTYDSSEASSTSSYNGVYYNDGGKNVTAGDMAKGAWVGAYSKNIPDTHYPNGIVAAIASNFDTEMSSQRGPMAISGTYEGARATAGSSAWWNLAQKDSIGGAVVSTNIETYGPTPGKPTLVRKGDDPFGRRSVAFTNLSPNSAAQSFQGMAQLRWQQGMRWLPLRVLPVTAKPPPETIGHRAEGSNGVLDNLAGRRLLRGAAKLLSQKALPPPQQEQAVKDATSAAAVARRPWGAVVHA